MSPAVTAYYLLSAALVFCSGPIFERFGPRPVVGIGSVGLALGIALLTQVNQLWHVYLAFGTMSVGYAAMSSATINIIIAPWFDRRRGLAVSFALNGASAGGIVVAPLLIFLIGRFGITTALVGIVACMLAVVIPILAILRPKRVGESDRVDRGNAVPLKQATEASGDTWPTWRLARILRTRAFQTISIPFALGFIAQVGFLTHQFAYLSPRLGDAGAAWGVSLTAFSALLGRIATGFVLDRADRRAVACGNFLVQMAGMTLVMVNGSAAVLYLGCVLFGLGVGNMVSLPGLLVQQEFPSEYFSRTVGLVVAVNQFMFALGPGLLGYLYWIGGSYIVSFGACLVMQTVAAIVIILPAVGAAKRRST